MKLKPEETNVIEFEISVKGVNRYSLIGHLRIIIDGIEWGFPAKLDASTIKIEVPPLSSIVKKEFQNGDKFPAKLEVVGDGHHMEPWADNIEIDSKFTIDVTKVKNESGVFSPSIKIMGVKDTKIEEKKSIIEEKPIEERKPTVVNIVEKDLTKTDVEILDEDSTERIMRKVLKEDESESTLSKSKFSTLSGTLMQKLGI